MTTAGEAAIAYARRGWAVFPLSTPTPEGGCSCRKKSCIEERRVGKHPRTAHGKDDASTDEATIERWWSMWPDANIGIACAASGLVAIDIDPDKGGNDSFDALVDRFGRSIFKTVTAMTGGGGTHLVYRNNGTHIGDVANGPKYTGPLGPGIDVRGPGYIVVAPSLHATGAFYEWEAGWSPDDLDPLPFPKELEDLLLPAPMSQERVSRVNMHSILEGVPQGERDWQLFLAASKLRGADVPIDFAYNLIEDAAANCTPPLSRATARQKVDSAYRYPAGRKAYERAVQGAEDGPATFDGLRALLEEAISHGVPEPEWLIEGVLVRGSIHTIYGEPESGKTILALAWMAEVAASGQNVVFLDEESGLASVASRMAAMGVEGADEHIYYLPFPGLDQPRFEALLADIDTLQPALIVCDSLTDMLAAAGLDENSGTEVTQWFKMVPETLSRRDYAPALALLDHVTKDLGNTKYSVGSRAKKSKSDVQWFVEKGGEFNRLKTAPVTLWLKKNRPGVMPPAVRYTVGGEDGRLIVRREEYGDNDISDDLTDGARKMLEILRAGGESMTNQAIRERFEGGVDDRPHRDSVRKWGHELVLRGLISRTGEGREVRYLSLSTTAESAVNRQYVGSPGEGAALPISGTPPLGVSRVGSPPPGGSAKQRAKERWHDVDA